MDGVTERAYAKLNLTLDVVGKEGEYHLLRSAVCTVDLFDEVTLLPCGKNGIEMSGEGLGGLLKEQNNAFRAMELFSRRTGKCARAVIKKHIPVGMGLGGSSADCAAVISGMGRLFSVKGDILREIAAESASDAPFQMTGGFALMEGRGEKISPLPFLKAEFLIVCPDKGISTPRCFRVFDEMRPGSPPKARFTSGALPFLVRGDLAGAAKEFGNALLPAACVLNPQIGEALSDMGALPCAGYGMTGSGSAVFGLFSDGIEDAEKKLAKRYRVIRASSVKIQ